MNRRRAFITILAAGGDPIILPATNQIFEFFAGDGFSIPALVTASADGGPVTTWTDKVAARAPTQSVLSAKPTYHKTGFGTNSRGSIEFDGGDNLLTAVAGNVLPASANFTIHLVYKTTSTTLNILMYYEYNTGNATPLARVFMNGLGADRVRFQVRDDASTIVDFVSEVAAANDGNPHILTCERVGNVWNTYFDGTACPTPPTAALGATTINELQIGAASYVGDLALLTAYSAAYDASIVTTLKTYYGIA